MPRDRKPLSEQAPEGNVALLLYRLTERAGQLFCPREWPVFRPFIEAYVEREFRRQ